MTNLREEIEKIIEELFSDAEDYIEGKFYTRKEYITQATDQILQAFQDCLPPEEKEEDIECIKSDINVARKMIEIYEERGGGYSQKEALETLIRITEKYIILAQIRGRIGR